MQLTREWLARAIVIAAPVVLSSYLAFAADTAAPASPASPSASAPDAAAAPRQNTAIVPALGVGANRHPGFVERAKQGNVDLLFVGDSITDLWTPTARGAGAGPGRGAGAPGAGRGAGAPGSGTAAAPARGPAPGAAAATTSATAGRRGGRGGRGGAPVVHGQAVWDEYYKKRNPFNIGISGETTQGVLWRLDNGEVDGIKPKAAVVMIGTNNSGRNTAEEIGEGVTAVVKKLREKLPETKVLLLAIFPRGVDPAQANVKATRDKLAKASEIASKVADGKMIHYMDIGPKFLDANGVLSPDIFPDALHPNEKGYRIWAEAIEPKVKELMGEK